MEIYKKYLLYEEILTKVDIDWASDSALEEWDNFTLRFLQGYGEDEYGDAFADYFDYKFIKYWNNVFNNKDIFNEFIDQLNIEIKKFEKKNKIKIGKLKFVGQKQLKIF